MLGNLINRHDAVRLYRRGPRHPDMLAEGSAIRRRGKQEQDHRRPQAPPIGSIGRRQMSRPCAGSGMSSDRHADQGLAAHRGHVEPADAGGQRRRHRVRGIRVAGRHGPARHDAPAGPLDQQLTPGSGGRSAPPAPAPAAPTAAQRIPRWRSARSRIMAVGRGRQGSAEAAGRNPGGASIGTRPPRRPPRSPPRLRRPRTRRHMRCLRRAAVRSSSDRQRRLVRMTAFRGGRARLIRGRAGRRRWRARCRSRPAAPPARPVPPARHAPGQMALHHGRVRGVDSAHDVHTQRGADLPQLSVPSRHQPRSRWATSSEPRPHTTKRNAPT